MGMYRSQRRACLLMRPLFPVTLKLSGRVFRLCRANRQAGIPVFLEHKEPLPLVPRLPPLLGKGQRWFRSKRQRQRLEFRLLLLYRPSLAGEGARNEREGFFPKRLVFLPAGLPYRGRMAVPITRVSPGMRAASTSKRGAETGTYPS